MIAVLFALLFAPLAAVRAPTPIAILQHQIEDVSERVQRAVAQLAAAHTPEEKRHADAALVDLRLELADLSDRVEHERVQSQR